MTLRPCYRATCDAPGCTSAEMLAHERSGPARAELEALGWRVIPHREAPVSGAPRILYACPLHRDWCPATQLPTTVSLRDRWRPKLCRAAMIWMLRDRGDSDWMLQDRCVSDSAIAAAGGLSRARVAELGDLYEGVIAGRQRDAADWQEPWAKRLRAAGAIP